MAKNDSLFMKNQDGTRALKLYDFNELYYMDSNRNIKRKSDDLTVLEYNASFDFGYIFSHENESAITSLITDMVANDYVTTPQNSGVIPYNPFIEAKAYYQEYGVFLKLLDKKLFDKEFWLTLLPGIGGDGSTYTQIYPAMGYKITNYDASIPMNNQDLGVQGYALYLGFVNEDDTPFCSVGYIYDVNGKVQIIFLNKTESYGNVFFASNDDLLTEGIKANHSLVGGAIQSLSFDLRDSENFEYGNEAESGGYSGGTWDNSSDDIGIPDDPNFDFTTQGCGTLYRVFNIKTVLNEIFPDYETPSGIDALAEYVHNIFEMQNSQALKEYIVDAYAIPVTPILGEEENIQIGWKTLNHRARPVRKQWVTVSCGRYNLKEYYSNFLDYDTQIKLYLPFVGLTDINPEFALGTVEVVYKFDVVSGEFMCYVLSNSAKSQLNSVIAQYNGNAITHFPLNAIDYSSKVNGAINGITNIASGVVEGANKDVLGAVSDVSTGIMNVATSHPTASMSNSYSGSGALMGIRKPFYLIGRAVGQFSSKYRSEVGLPLNVAYKLSDVHGFTVCQIDDIKIENATEEERNAVCELLRSGIIL